jgi:hypothetical protein
MGFLAGVPGGPGLSKVLSLVVQSLLTLTRVVAVTILVDDGSEFVQYFKDALFV